MEDNEFRMGVIFITWIAAAAIMIAGSPSSFVQGILLLFAIAATVIIAIAPYMSESEHEKAKRGASIDENEIRLRVLMDLLSEEDKDRMRAKLMNGFSDGELPVDELLDARSGDEKTSS